MSRMLPHLPSNKKCWEEGKW